ncbi:MAG: hypothetical protein ACYTFT_13690, partial [Planctomycetota bacterium]
MRTLLLRPRFAFLFAVLALGGAVGSAPLAAQEMPASDSSQLDPTLNDVLDRLELYPHDPYLQYAALVLTRRKGVGHEELERLSRIVDGR